MKNYIICYVLHKGSTATPKTAFASENTPEKALQVFLKIKDDETIGIQEFYEIKAIYELPEIPQEKLLKELNANGIVKPLVFEGMEIPFIIQPEETTKKH